MNGVRKSADHAALRCDLNLASEQAYGPKRGYYGRVVVCIDLANELANATDRSLPPTFIGASHFSGK